MHYMEKRTCQIVSILCLNLFLRLCETSIVYGKAFEECFSDNVSCLYPFFPGNSTYERGLPMMIDLILLESKNFYPTQREW